MSDPTERHGTYVRKVNEEARRYAQDLLAENEKLRLLVASLETENARLEEKLRSSGDLPKEIDVLRGLVTSLEKEKVRLQEQLLAVRDQLDRHLSEQSRLQRRLEEIEKENRRFSEQYVQVEEQSSNLANLYVASYRLHGTLDREELLGTLQEIVANLIGSEEMGIFELDAAGSSLRLLAAFGIDSAAYASLPADEGLVGSVVKSGEIFVSRGDPAELKQRLPRERDLTACIPLKLEDRVFGAVLLFRLLPQKVGGFVDIDHELFDLLATQAATALYASDLHARLARETEGR
jgi:hypothetical protein